MSTGSESVLYRLCDVYLMATLLLTAAWFSHRLMSEPIHRLTVSWATALGLAAIVLLTCIPGWPRAHPIRSVHTSNPCSRHFRSLFERVRRLMPNAWAACL